MRSSRFMRRVVAFALIVRCLSTIAVAAERSSPKDDGTAARSAEAAQLVRKALEAEVSGNTQERADYLRQALATDPGYAPAHWQLGEVRVGGAWLPLDAAAAQSSWSGKFAKYRQLRDAADGTVNDQMKLARWCADAGLKDQERLHLVTALQSFPAKGQPREIMTKLGLVRYRKQLMPVAQAESLKQQAKKAETAMQEWKPRLVRLRGDLESRDKARQETAAQELVAIQDVDAIPAIEVTFAKATPDAGTAAVAGIAAMDGQPATDSLVRHAVFAQQAAVRKAAAEALRACDVFSYTPVMLSNLRMPIEVSFQVSTDPVGGFRERLSLFREGPLYNVSFVSSHVADPDIVLLPSGAPGVPARAAVALPPRDAGRVLADAQSDVRLAVMANANNEQAEFLNARVAEALQVATKNDFGADPKLWWDWWTQYNELHYPQDRPTYEAVRYVSALTTPSPPHSCFVPGTKVWTVTGTVPIEKVQVGDWVLAQDVDSGELAYRPVSATTAGPPLPLVDIRTGGGTIRCTHGHLFWVSGTGWRMAKELQAGELMHTARGPIAIESVEKKGESSCHNLIVPDFNTYFVTDEQVLVHDINVRSPTRATVPGLVDN